MLSGFILSRSSLLLLLVGGISFVLSQQSDSVLGQLTVDQAVRLIEQPETSPRVAGISNGNTNSLSRGIQGVQGRPAPSPSLEIEPSILRNADRNLAQNENEQNFRSLFSTTDGPDQFFTPDAATDASDVEVKQTARFSAVTNTNANTLFNANGEPNSQDTARVAARLRSQCIYDSANNLACNSQYREPTGRCTSVTQGRKTWGMAGTPFTRILTPKYEDGVGSRRVTEFTTSKRLPSPRKISTTVTTNNVVLNFAGVNAQIMQWGQFIAHEFTQIAESDPNAACCPDQIFDSQYGSSRTASRADLTEIRDLVSRFRGDVCQQIENENDSEYGEDICMNHVRTRPTPQHNCLLGPRQQMNTVTHVFDASNVYGSSQRELNLLRDSTGGKLKSQVVNGASLPPPNTAGCPAAKAQANRCPFLGGDSRINTTPNLISAHTAFVNKHNQIAVELASINSHWNNEKLFQETRKIISGIQSNIHFYEWLPIIIGSTVSNKYNLGSYDGYDENENPSILNELAGAAMRFGHSTIDGFFTLKKDNGQSDFVDLRQKFFDSDIVYQDGTKQCVRGLIQDTPWIVDKNFPTQMRDFLFDQKRDIVSLNLNRGRDHGFNSYVDYRKHYNLSVPTSFSQLSSTHPADVIADLRRVYTNVGDIELYIGGVTERPVSGGLVGELFANILADGFSRTRKGDRYFFERRNSGLTSSQISAIKRYTFGQLLCEGNSMSRILNKAFFREGFQGSTEVACTSFPKLNLRLWRDKPADSPKCFWQTYITTPCCRGRRTVHRRCIGRSRSCRCRGSSRVRESCRCSGFRCFNSYFDCYRSGILQVSPSGPIDRPQPIGGRQPIGLPRPIRRPSSGVLQGPTSFTNAVI